MENNFEMLFQLPPNSQTYQIYQFGSAPNDSQSDFLFRKHDPVEDSCAFLGHHISLHVVRST
jgi:hypothetical protein